MNYPHKFLERAELFIHMDSGDRRYRLITQDVQEDLPGVGCAVTFFLCAISEDPG